MHKGDCEIPDYIPGGLGPRINISIAVVMGWLAFAIIFLLFWVSDMTVLQAIGIVIVSIIVLIAILGVVWASWGIKVAKMRKQMSAMEEEFEEKE